MKKLCALLTALLLLLACASAEAVGTPIQPCHQVTMEKLPSTTQTGATVSLWHIQTELPQVDAELNALADAYAQEISPLLQKPGKGRAETSTLQVRILHSRTGLKWMSFEVQARWEYYRQTQQVQFTTRTYDMVTGQRILLTDVFPADSPAWDLLAQTVRDTLHAYYPQETADDQAVERLCSREALEQLDFTLHGMSLVLHLPSIYPSHPQLMQATLYYPDIRPYMTKAAQEQTDNASLYAFCALTFDDGPNQWITPHVLDRLMQHGERATFFLVGSRIRPFGYLAQQEHDEGHAIATHFYEHLYAQQAGKDTFQPMYQKVNDAHNEVLGIAPTYARAPGGQWYAMSKHEVGWPLIQWTSEARDWDGDDQGPDYTRTARTTLSTVKNGGIILMHDMKINSAKAMDIYLPELQARGYMLLTVDELFAKDGVTLMPNQAYFRCVDGVTTSP